MHNNQLSVYHKKKNRKVFFFLTRAPTAHQYQPGYKNQDRLLPDPDIPFAPKRLSINVPLDDAA